MLNRGNAGVDFPTGPARRLLRSVQSDRVRRDRAQVLPNLGLNRKQKKQVSKIAKARALGLGETKYHQLSNPGVEVTSAGRLIPLTSGIPKGNDDNDRIGDKVMLTKFQFNFQFTGPADDTQNLCRLILFFWMRTTDPTMSDILDTSYPSVNTPMAP